MILYIILYIIVNLILFITYYVILDSGIYDAKRDPITFVPLPPGPPILTEVREISSEATSSSAAYFIPSDVQDGDAKKIRAKGAFSGTLYIYNYVTPESTTQNL